MYHPNPLIDAAVAASVRIAKRSNDPATTLANYLSMEADDPRWTRQQAAELQGCLSAALASLAEPKGGY
jgi:hypothetical protein